MLERVESVPPELVEPASQFAETVRIDAVDTARPFRSIDHETRVFQGFEVLRDGRAAHRQRDGNHPHRGRAVAQPLEYGAASRVGKCH